MAGKKLKASGIILLCAIIIVSILPGCQPTPGEPPVVNKGDNHLEDMIASSAQSLEPGPAQLSSLAEALGAPATYQDSFSNGKGDVSVTVDADVQIPDVESFPVIQVKISDFSQEQVDRFAAYFLKDAELFTEEQVRTKEEIQVSIIEEQQQLDMMKGDKEGTEMVQGYLKDLEKEYSKAPEQRKRTAATTQLNDTEYGRGISVVAELGKDEAALFDVYNSDAYRYFHFHNTGKGRYEPDFFQTEPQSGPPRGMEMTRDEAEQAVMQCLAGLGINNMQTESTDIATFFRNSLDYNDEDYKKSAKQCYVFNLVRTVGGIPLSNIQPSTPLDTDDPEAFVPEEPDYNLVREPEKLEILVDDTGIVQFNWVNPTEEIGVLSEHAALMPFHDVLQKAKDNMFYKNYTAYGSSAEIVIWTIKLGMMRIMRKDKPDEYLLVPVWDFIGNHKDIIGNKDEWLPFGAESFVTINAIDGSNINRGWGY